MSDNIGRFQVLVPYIKQLLNKHHELYSVQCKDVLWEEIFSRALIQAGLGSDWSPDYNHKIGTDQTCGDGKRCSNKSGVFNKTDSSVKISGSRTTKHKTIDDKIKFLSINHEDYILCLSGCKKEWKQGMKKYYFIVIDSNDLNYADSNWTETIGSRGRYKDKVSGWKCITENFNAHITKGTCDQLWTTVKKSVFKEFYEINIGD